MKRMESKQIVQHSWMVLFRAALLTIIIMVAHNTMTVSAATVAKIGSKKYAKFETALANVKNGQKIKLMKNTTLTFDVSRYGIANNMLSDKKNITIDLGKHTLKINGHGDNRGIHPGALRIIDCQNITVKNGTIDGDLQFEGTSGKCIVSSVKVKGDGDPDEYYTDGDIGHSASGKVTLRKVTAEKISVNGENSKNPASMVIESGKYGFLLAMNSGIVKIKGGTFSFTKDSNTRDYMGETTILQIENGAKVDVSGGKFTSKRRVANVSSSTLIIKNTSMTSTGRYDSPVISANNSTIKITGGTFTAKNDKVSVYDSDGYKYIRYDKSNNLNPEKYAAVFYLKNGNATLKNCTLINKNALKKSHVLYSENCSIKKSKVTMIAK